MAEPEGDKLVLCVSTDPVVKDDAEYAFPSDVTVRCVSDAREAWSVLEGMTPHCVVVDIQAGSAGGINLAKDMSQDPRLDPVPIVMLLQRAEDKWLATEGGADAILVKPVASDALVRETIALIS
jgi:DNA-binding response OmpR family regulator